MAIEAVRGCGYRKVGGIYLVGEGLAAACDRLPLELHVCPVCSQGIKFSRGFSWIDGYRLYGVHENCQDEAKERCPICFPQQGEKQGLLWVGEKFYTPHSFVSEALKMGVSKRIANIPRGLKIGETWVFLGHKKAVSKMGDTDRLFVDVPGIFYAFRPARVEKLIWQRDATKENLEQLEKHGITPVIVPDGDPDHMAFEE